MPRCAPRPTGHGRDRQRQPIGRPEPQETARQKTSSLGEVESPRPERVRDDETADDEKDRDPDRREEHEAIEPVRKPRFEVCKMPGGDGVEEHDPHRSQAADAVDEGQAGTRRAAAPHGLRRRQVSEAVLSTP